MAKNDSNNIGKAASDGYKDFKDSKIEGEKSSDQENIGTNSSDEADKDSGSGVESEKSFPQEDELKKLRSKVKNQRADLDAKEKQIRSLTEGDTPPPQTHEEVELECLGKEKAGIQARLNEINKRESALKPEAPRCFTGTDLVDQDRKNDGDNKY